MIDYINKSSLSNGGINHQVCSYEFPNLKDNHVCDVNLLKDFGNCTSEKQYGYNNSSPCIFIKLNKVINLFYLVNLIYVIIIIIIVLDI